ncbi:VPLPA-CTERM sorting domain-containing protein [Rubellimicrobium aerolatum]|uniref:VPLPA-CTERM sorting domain-containing protein n=1 Tax=Rubellimicrobium aerolatum TaxID=490979 RepID=A0ABW0SIE1_9RHOB|nr:VPLPA-CTERM sorting domain-containing protein [Rubellimicrobium aerolatum]MBP1807791.1 hypothetical protein [Rubellimicrobium aerolatum]
MKTLRAASLAIAFALAPLAASALTLSPSNSITADQTVEMSTPQAWHWDANFDNGEGPSTYLFHFHNASTKTGSLDFVFNVRQLSAYFTDGVRITFGDLVWDIEQAVWQQGGRTDQSNFLVFAPGETKTLTIDFGKVVKGAVLNATANINFDSLSPSSYAAPVPVPAAGIMLMTSLAGLGALRRRRKAA